MNPKQLACLILCVISAAVFYFGQTWHKNVLKVQQDATAAEDDAKRAENDLQVAETMLTTVKHNSQEVRRFFDGWRSHILKYQTEQEIEAAIEYSLRDKGITLIRGRKSETKPVAATDAIGGKFFLTTISIEDDYSKVMNWFGDIEKKIPLSSVLSCNFKGGSNLRQIQLTVSLAVPIWQMKSITAL
jgi:hypothetical protein